MNGACNMPRRQEMRTKFYYINWTDETTWNISEDDIKMYLKETLYEYMK